MNWKRSALAIGLTIPIIALFYFGMQHDPREIPSPLPGRPAPQFSMAQMGGGDSVRLADLKGQVVVLNFWASWCLACRDEHQALIQSANEWAPKGVKFYGVLYNDQPENGQQYLSEMGFWPYPTLLDPKTRTAIDFGLYGVPETFFIGKDGRVAYKQVGPITTEKMRRILEPMLQGKQPEVGG